MEQRRGCGWRKVGGIYLVGEGLAMECGRLPFALHVCPVCKAGVKFSRGWTWLDWKNYAGDCLQGCACHNRNCAVCLPRFDQYGLMWVGEKHYSPESFVIEALQMGVSKRIASIPRGFKVGESWVLLAHKKALPEEPDGNGEQNRSGIFYAFRPARIEQLVRESDLTEEKKELLKKRGITPVEVPDNWGSKVKSAEMLFE